MRRASNVQRDGWLVGVIMAVLGAGCGGRSEKAATPNDPAADSGGSRAGDSDAQAGAGGSDDVPGFDDLVIESNQMSAYEGLSVVATFDVNFDANSRSLPRTARVVDGAFKLRWRQGFNRDAYGTYFVLFVDRDADGACTEGIDPAWSDFVNNDFASDQPLVHDFAPTGTFFVARITCADFDSWFGHPFKGL